MKIEGEIITDMRMLFEIDTKDYDINGTTFSRPSARGIIIKDGKVAMIHSLKYDYYKFPGGGIENGEGKKNALIREVLEETGLTIKPDTIQEYGMVHRIQKGDYEIETNNACKHWDADKIMLKRENKVINILIEEGFL